MVLAEAGSHHAAISALSAALGCAALVPYLRLFRTLRWSVVGGGALLGISAIHAARYVQVAGSASNATAWSWFLQSAVLATLAVVLLAALDRRERQPEDTGPSRGPSAQDIAKA